MIGSDALIRLLNALAFDCENTDGWEEAATTIRQAASGITDLTHCLRIVRSRSSPDLRDLIDGTLTKIGGNQ